MVKNTDSLEIVIKILEKNFEKIDEVSKKMNQLDNNIKKSSNSTEQLSMKFRNLKNFLLSTGLSFLFTGMAIARFFKGILSTIFQTFLLVKGESGIMNNAVDNLKASLIFLKFSLTDAFVNTGAAQSWIDSIQGLIDKFNSMDETSKSTFVDMTIKIFLVSTALMFLGQVALGFIGILELLSVVTAPFTLIVLAVLVLIFLFIRARKVTGSWKRAFILFGHSVLMVVGLIFDAVQDYLLSPIYLFIWLLNKAIKLYNRLTGSSIGTIELTGVLNPTRFYDMAKEYSDRKIREMAAEKMVEDANKRIGNNLVNPSIGPNGFGGGNTYTFNIGTILGDEQGITQMLEKTLRNQIDFIGGSPQNGG